MAQLRVLAALRVRVREVLIVAGEASGDMHAGAVAEQLAALRPDLTLTGFGGDRMAAAGVTLFRRTAGVVGFVEILRHLPAHWSMLRSIRARLRGGRVKLVMCVDYGGFNLRVAAAAKAEGVPVLYFITPQVWASRAGRLKEMARTITKAAVILPFEEELLRSHGIDATFVGHPLLDSVSALPTRAEARQRLQVPDNVPLLAMFPGSRPQEIDRHLMDFARVEAELRRRIPALRSVVAGATTAPITSPGFNTQVVDAASLTLFRAADVALCKSGTTTLEAALAGCPCAIVYRTSPITYAIAKRVVTIGRIGLLNIVAGREVAPEFVQDAFVPTVVADALEPLFPANSPARAAMLQGLAEVRARLGSPGASGRVAQMASHMVPG